MFNKNSKMGKNVRAARRLAAILMAGTLTGTIVAGTAPAVIVSAATWQENADYIFDCLIKRLKYSEAAACGIMANIRCESTFNPHAWNAGGGSYGLCQWTGGRYGRLQHWCGLNGYDYTTIDGQLAYLEYELQNYYPGVENYLRSVENTRDGAYNAGQYYCYHFEAPASRGSVSVYRGGLASGTFWESYRPSEWYLVDGTWRYVLRDGSYHKGWLTLDKQTFYLDKEGRRVSGWNTIDGKRYYFDEKGVMITGWYKVDGRNYYFANDGSLVTGVVRGDDELYPVDNFGGIQGATAMEKYAPEWIARDEERKAELASAEAGNAKEDVSDLKEGKESPLAQAETDEEVFAQAEEAETTPAGNTDEDSYALAEDGNVSTTRDTAENMNSVGIASGSESDSDKQLASSETDKNTSLASAKKNDPKSDLETDASAKRTAALQEEGNQKTSEEEEQFTLAAEAMKAAAENLNEDSGEEPEAQVFVPGGDQEDETIPEAAAPVGDDKDVEKAGLASAETQDSEEKADTPDVRKADTPETSASIDTGITAPFARAESEEAAEKSASAAGLDQPFGLPGMIPKNTGNGNGSKENPNAPVYSLPFSYTDAANMLSKEYGDENEKKSSDSETEPADSVIKENDQRVPFAGETSGNSDKNTTGSEEKPDRNKADSDEKNGETIVASVEKTDDNKAASDENEKSDENKAASDENEKPDDNKETSDEAENKEAEDKEAEDKESENKEAEDEGKTESGITDKKEVTEKESEENEDASESRSEESEEEKEEEETEAESKKEEAESEEKSDKAESEDEDESEKESGQEREENLEKGEADEEIQIILKKDIPDISRDEMDDLVEILRKKNILHAVSGNGLNITPKVKASFEQDDGDKYTVTFSVEYNGSEAELESSVRITD